MNNVVWFNINCHTRLVIVLTYDQICIEIKRYIIKSKTCLISAQYKLNQAILLLFTWEHGYAVKNSTECTSPEKRVQSPLYLPISEHVKTFSNMYQKQS
jgi:hypothetical protein